MDDADNDDSVMPPPIFAETSLEPGSGTLLIVDDAATLRCSFHLQRPSIRYASAANAVDQCYVCSDMELVEACTVEAHPPVVPRSNDANSWKPAL
jgi:hypothetical protein